MALMWFFFVFVCVYLDLLENLTKRIYLYEIGILSKALIIVFDKMLDKML